MSHTPKDSSFPEFLHKNLMSLSYKDLEFYLTRDKYKTNMLDYHISDLFSKGRKGKGELMSERACERVDGKGGAMCQVN